MYKDQIQSLNLSTSCAFSLLQEHPRSSKEQESGAGQKRLLNCVVAEGKHKSHTISIIFEGSDTC